METQPLYHILDPSGRYFCYNDFNGKASFLPADSETGEIPSIAYSMPKEMAESKMNYLMNHTDNPTSRPNKKFDRWTNNFTELFIVPAEGLK